jgi:hypothetical protein
VGHRARGLQRQRRCVELFRTRGHAPIRIWLRGEDRQRPFGRASGNALDEERDHERYWFHEYFHGDTGGGLGASHQTGWTGLVAKLIQQQGEFGTIRKPDPFTDL